MPRRDYTKPQEPADPHASYFTIQEVAFLTKYSVNTIRRMIKAGAPHSQRVPGGGIRISREDVPQYYDAHRVGPAPVRHRRQVRAAA
ncbi:helix-turn-helix domain-containing protein [Streptomyces sp. NPDC051453]|uniref:helix-turn-helix domain-containing protein n=1 Tax=Streptomyces sp. NPDC051453 TaxID=3154941 RepID=UPI00342AE4DA